METELSVFDDPEHSDFERTYGWAWFLKLCLEVRNSPLDDQKGSCLSGTPFLFPLWHSRPTHRAYKF